MSRPEPVASAGTPVDLPYRIPWRSRQVRAGAHRGTLAGAGGLFRDSVTLLEHPDPRRIDIRTTIRDPFEAIYVRRFEQKTAITVHALVDVSASMAFSDGPRKIDLAADLVQSLAASARRIGDGFGLIGCDALVRPELFYPATRSRGGEAEMVARLRSFTPEGEGSAGLEAAAAMIGGRRKLVVLISDFLIPQRTLARVFRALAPHDVLPVAVRFSRELAGLPNWGLLPLADLETGRRRLAVLRPSLHRAWLERESERRAELGAIASRYGRRPFEIVDRIDWGKLTGRLLEGR